MQNNSIEVKEPRDTPQPTTPDQIPSPAEGFWEWSSRLIHDPFHSGFEALLVTIIAAVLVAVIYPAIYHWLGSPGEERTSKNLKAIVLLSVAPIVYVSAFVVFLFRRCWLALRRP